MQIKIPIAMVVVVVIGAAYAAPAKVKDSCEPLFEGNMEYTMNLLSDEGPRGHNVHQVGVMEYKNGKLVLNQNGKKGTKFEFARCGTKASAHKREVAIVGKMKMEDGQCLVFDDKKSKLVAGKCGKDAEIFEGRMWGYKNFDLDLRSEKTWSQIEDGEEMALKKPQKSQTSINLEGKIVGLGGGQLKCKTLVEDVKLSVDGKEVAERHGKLVAGNGKGAKVSIEACEAPGFSKGDSESTMTSRVVSRGKCLTVRRKGEANARFETCAKEGEKLEEQWMDYDETVEPLDKAARYLGVTSWKKRESGEIVGSEAGADTTDMKVMVE